MGGELDGKQGTPQGQAGALDAQGQAPAQQQQDEPQQAQDQSATNAPVQGAAAGQGAEPQAGGADDEGRLAQYEKRIAELESQVAEAARCKEAEARLTAEIEALKKDQADQQLDFSLERAGVRNVKAARALLDDYEDDVAKLKEAMPWIFEEPKPNAAPQQTGTTGLEPQSAASGSGDELARWREIAGLPDKK